MFVPEDFIVGRDQALSELKIPAAVSRKLDDLEIRSVRQFYSRLRDDGPRLQEYLKLKDVDFASLYRKVEGVIKDEYPEDMIPRIHPRVKKTGVAVHRLNDPARPRFGKRGKD